MKSETTKPAEETQAASALATNAEPPVSPAVVKNAPNSQAKPKKPVAQSKPATKPAPKPASAQPAPVTASPEPEPEQTEAEPAESDSPLSIFGWD